MREMKYFRCLIYIDVKFFAFQVDGFMERKSKSSQNITSGYMN